MKRFPFGVAACLRELNFKKSMHEGKLCPMSIQSATACGRGRLIIDIDESLRFLRSTARYRRRF